jgi:hypothetical protein
LRVADPPEAWAELGFAVDDGAVVALGGVRVQLGADGSGITGWSLRGLDPCADLDGLPPTLPDPPPPAPAQHPNGALTPDFDRTTAKLRAAGFDYRRARDAGNGLRQAFFVLGPCLLELAGPAEVDRAHLWGLTLTVHDLDATATRLGERLGRVKDAVQPGRRIATVRREAGLSVPLALMSPRPQE